ncbi:MAG: hypothetical protein H0V92_12005 [Pseudonocardiales bacterium]|nr:hypothetical protein [Pseudonocardiales bacterium]
MAAVEVLKNLNTHGGRKVPEDAPTSFVPTRYAEYLEKARTVGDDTGYRHFWELCVILKLRDGLRSGDIFVPGSRRYADPATYLFTPDQWELKRGGFCALVNKPAKAADAWPKARKSCTPRSPSWKAPSPSRCPAMSARSDSMRTTSW